MVVNLTAYCCYNALFGGDVTRVYVKPKTKQRKIFKAEKYLHLL